jgi:hypothetical protein
MASDAGALAAGGELVGLSGVMLVVDVLACGEFRRDSAESLEFNDAMTAAPSASVPTAGVFPSSLPAGVGTGEVVSELIVKISVVPVPLAWRGCKEMGVDNMMKRFEGALALRTTSKFLHLC